MKMAIEKITLVKNKPESEYDQFDIMIKIETLFDRLNSIQQKNMVKYLQKRVKQ